MKNHYIIDLVGLALVGDYVERRDEQLVILPFPLPSIVPPPPLPPPLRLPKSSADDP